MIWWCEKTKFVNLDKWLSLGKQKASFCLCSLNRYFLVKDDPILSVRMVFIEWSEAQFSFFKNPIRVANISNVKKSK